MKALLEFNIPEDEPDFKIALQAHDVRACLHQIDQTVRAWLKYGHSYEKPEQVMKIIRDMIPQELIHDP